jgi:hypothetical protein
MIINYRFARLRSSLLRSYTSVIILHTICSCVTVVQCTTPIAILLIWARSWGSTLDITSSTSSRLIRSACATINIMYIFLESVCYFSLVLFSLSTILSMSLLTSICRLLIRPIIVCLPSSRVSWILMEVLFWGLPTHFISCMFGLSNRTRSLHAWARGSRSSWYSLGMRSILLNNVDGWLHGWWALTTTSSISLRSHKIGLNHIVGVLNRVIRPIPAIIFILPIWLFIMKVGITIQIGVSTCLFNLLAGRQFLQISDAWLQTLNALFLPCISISLGLSLLMNVHRIISGWSLRRLMLILLRVALIIVVSTTAITSSIICFSLHFD